MVYCLVNPLIADLHVFSLIAKVCLLISLNMSFTFVISAPNFLLIGFFSREGIWLINQSAKELIFDRTLFPKSLKTSLKTLFHGLGTCVYFGTSSLSEPVYQEHRHKINFLLLCS